MTDFLIETVLVEKKLTLREKEIALYLANGARTNTIANKFRIKSNTVSTHKKNIFSKLGVHSSVDLYKMMNIIS
jgi:DNA-binding CsgD family transcriptional regulator